MDSYQYRWAAWPGSLLLFLMLVAPMIAELLVFKIALLGVVLLTIVIVTLATGRLALHPSICLWTYSLSAVGFFFIMEGLWKGIPGATEVVQLYVVWPIIYMLLIAGIRNEAIILGLTRTVIFSTICVAIYSIGYTLAKTHVLPNNGTVDFLFSDHGSQETLFVENEGFIRMQYPGLASLIFVVPFSFAALVVFRSSRFWTWTALILGLGSVLLSGRRALFLVTMTAPLLTLLFVCFQPVITRHASVKSLVRITLVGVFAIGVLLSCLSSMSGLNFDAMVEGFTAGFRFTPTETDTGASYRREQFHALLSSWMQNPILGSGYGAPAQGSIRSGKNTWNYELTYMALLHQTGILGVTAYGAAIVWVYWMGAKIIRSGGTLSALMVACLVGMSSMLVANATNPYFGTFERYWAIFLPIGLINWWLVKRSEVDLQRHTA